MEMYKILQGQKMKIKNLFISTALLVSSMSVTALNALTPEEIVELHDMKPYAKAKKQWKRVFKKEKKLKKLGLNEYSEKEKSDLLNYLIKNAADSDNPTVPGI